MGHEVRTKNDHGIVTEDGWQGIDKVLHPGELKFYSSKPPLLPTLVAGEYWLLKKLFGWSIVQERWQVVRVILLTVFVKTQRQEVREVRRATEAMQLCVAEGHLAEDEEE